MPAGPIGSCWQAGSWLDTAWEEFSWAAGIVILVPIIDVVGSFLAVIEVQGSYLFMIDTVGDFSGN